MSLKTKVKKSEPDRPKLQVFVDFKTYTGIQKARIKYIEKTGEPMSISKFIESQILTPYLTNTSTKACLSN